MSLVSTDFRVFRAAVNDDTAANGGLITFNESVSGVSGNLFPRVSLSERQGGVNRLRKAFYRINSTGGHTLFDAHLFMFKHTPAVDAITFFATDFTSTQGDVLAGIEAETHYGAGTLAASALSGAVSISVTPEQSVYPVFRQGDRIYLSDKAVYGSGTGNEEYNIIDSVTPDGDNVTIGLATPLLYGYDAIEGRVASILDHGDLAASATVLTQTVGGNLSLNAGSITVNQRGSLYDTITLTFTSASGFTASSDLRGSLGTGSVSSTFAPVNSQTASPYFSIPPAAWSGTGQQGDVITFRTTPAALSVMHYQQVPAGAPEFSSNSFFMAFVGETE